MKVTLHWLKQYVEFPWTAEELGERLTMLGFEVEGIYKTAGEFDGVVVAEVLTRDKHPNADRLSVCRVADGRGERQIVCGASNFKAGDKVPLILPGSSLPPKGGAGAPTVIKEGRIRGVESQGMLCSADELGLPKGEDGLLILPPDAVTGRPLAEHLGRKGAGAMLDLEITPNRPDLNSLIGVAREISASTGNPLRLPAVLAEDAGPAPVTESAAVSIRIEAPEGCARYTAHRLTGVKVGPSPAWLREALESVGSRSINNVVDITNYVMFETGQPLHAFDIARLAPGGDGRPTIVVRSGLPGEKITTLDGVERVLDAGHLVIADGARPVAVAGVMGAEGCGVTESTTEVLIESAWFLPSRVRRSVKSLGLRSESSHRFERGVDLASAAAAGRRAALLVAELAGGLLDPQVVDLGPAAAAAPEVEIRFQRVNDLLGVRISPEECDATLTRLGLRRVRAEFPDRAAYAPPAWRVDLKREADLIEEICRLYGVDRIASTPPRRVAGNSGDHDFDPVFDAFAELRRRLTALGLDEAQGQTLVHHGVAGVALAAAATPIGNPAGVGTPAVVPLANPLSADMDTLRPSLLPGLLDALAHNRAQRESDVRLFEIGRVFQERSGEVREGWRLALAMTGARAPKFWSGAEREARLDAFDLKGVLESLFEASGRLQPVFERAAAPHSFWAEAAGVLLPGGTAVGWAGQLGAAEARSRDLRYPVLLAELDLDVLLARRKTGSTFVPPAQFPGIRRDVALVAAESVTHEQVLQAVRKANPAHLASVELFDVYRGQPIPEGRKSMAYAFTYRASDKTLKETDVAPQQDRLVGVLREMLGAEIR